jgi:hypothetical protein
MKTEADQDTLLNKAWLQARPNSKSATGGRGCGVRGTWGSNASQPGGMT